MFTRRLIQSVVLFAVLTATGISLIVFGSSSTLPEIQRVFPLVGAGLFSGSLTAFLVDAIGQMDR